MNVPPPFSGIQLPLGCTLEIENKLLRNQLLNLIKIFNDAAGQPMSTAIVLKRGPKVTKVLVGNDVREVKTPSHLPELKAGMCVALDGQSSGILGMDALPVALGIVRIVKRVVDDEYLEIDIGPMGTAVVLYDGPKPEVGDQVLLDAGNRVVMRNLGQPKGSSKPAVETGISWDDIGGLKDVKASFMEAIEAAVIDRDLHLRYGKKPIKGMLLAGPPGCGKTLLGRAAATALAKIYGRESAATGFQYVSGPELLDRWVGGSEANIRKLFETARAHKKAHGYPSIIFLDEADALLAARSGGLGWRGMEQTVVPQFLTEMDGVADSGAMVIAATNRPDVLDPAFTRQGRIDLKVFVRRPNDSELVDIARRQLKGRPLEDQALDDAAGAVARELLSDRRALYMVRTKSGKDRRFTLGHLVSGAMSAGLIERAADFAIRREKESKKEGGIRAEDLSRAADALLGEQRVLSHQAEIAEMTESFKDDVRAVEKVKAA